MLEINASRLKGNELSEGGEAVIYEYKNKLIKVFKDCVDLSDKEEKIKEMLKLNMPKGAVCPKDVVYDSNSGRFIGYIMEKVNNGEEFKKLCSKKFIKLNNIDVKTVGVMLYELLNIIKKLHEQNIVIGDLNECNILFDKNYNVYIIDTDSWSVGKNKCTVAMELFKDPKMKKGNFTNETDWYAFAVLAFKCLTRIHPFGGNMSPDVPILERIEKGMSVIDNKNVTIPKALCKGWDFLSPQLIKDFKDIFNHGKRFPIDKSLKDFIDNLVLCKKHKDYYYSLYSGCPICEKDIKIVKKQPQTTSPTKSKDVIKIPYAKVFEEKNIKVMLNENVYVTEDDKVCFKDRPESYSYNNKIKYYTYLDTIVVSNMKQIGINDGSNIYKIDKLIGSRVIIRGDSLYYINSNNQLSQLKYSSKGNVIKKMQNVSFTHIYEVYDENHYFIINIFNSKKILCIDGFNIEVKMEYNIANYGLHFDPVSSTWMLIIEDDKNRFHTMVFKKNKMIYENNRIRLNCNLGYLCFYNNTLYIPKTRAIRGFNYKKNVYKDFECSILNVNSKLIKDGNKFTVVKDNGVYSVG